MNVTFLSYPEPIVWWQVLLVMVGHAVGAFSAGCVGTGGVVWVPLLMLLPSMTAKVAIGSTFVAVFFCNIMKAVIWHHAGKILWRRSMDFAIPALPGSLIGAVLVPYLPSDIVAMGVSILCLASSLQLARQSYVKYISYRNQNQNQELVLDADEVLPSPQDSEMLTIENEKEGTDDSSISEVSLAPDESPPEACKAGEGYFQMDTIQPGAEGLTGTSRRQFAIRACLGFVVSFLSAVTGTGGPVILFPIFFFLYPDTPPHLLMGTVIPFVTSLSLASTIGAIFFGSLDFGIALVMAINCGVFITVGSKMALRISAAKMKVMLAIVLLLTGVGTGAKHIIDMT